MKRSRGTIKKYVESSESDDERPLKKPSPAHDENNSADSSSSESDIENYLQKPEKLDFDSEFFNTKTTITSDFDKIEKNIFAGVKTLSDSESDSDKETEPKKDEKSTIQEKNEGVSLSRLTFNQLQDYTKKIEEAKKQVEIYKAKKRAQENKTDVLNLLAAGEGITGLEHTITPADLHSSDFESCDSEQENWEEIKTTASQEKRENNLVPDKGLQITVDMPDNVRKKKGVDLVAAMKRRLNRIRKENQILVHRVHLLCWIAHGNYVNSAINNTQTLAMALSLLPSEQSYPSDRTDLSYLEKITAWYKRTVKNINKVVPDNMPLDKCLQYQISRKEAYDKRMLAFIFVAILRSLGIQARIVMSLQVEPLRPPASDLHSVSTKESNNKKHGKGSTKSKQGDKSPKCLGSVSKASSSGKNSTSSIGKIISKIQPNTKPKTEIKINIQKPSPDKDNNLKNGSKRAPRKSTSDINPDKLYEKKSQTKGVEVTRKNSNTIEVDDEDKSKLGVAKTRRRTKSTDSVESVKTSNAKKSTKAQAQKSLSIPKNESKVKSGTPKTRKRAISTEIVDSVQSNDSQKTLNTKTQNSKKKIDIPENQTELKPKARKRAKSTESTDSVQSNSRRSTRLRPAKTPEEDNKVTESSLRQPTNRTRIHSTKSKGSEKVVKNNADRSKSLENVKSSRTTKSKKSKTITQVDGIYDSDSDVEMTLLQLDGANDKRQSKEKPKPNLKTLQKSAATQGAKKSYTKPDLKALSNKNSKKNVDPKKIEESDSDSEFEPSTGSPFKTRLEKAGPDLNKLKNIKRRPTKQVDVTKDIVSLVKGRISEQKRKERGRLVKKGKPGPDSDSDSDYAPEAIKKKEHDSDDDFVPKVKVKRRVQVHPVLSDSDNEKNEKKKKGNDVWVEVFLESEEKWISVDVVFGQVHCIKEISQRASHPISYVLAWDNTSNLKDVSQRYCINFNTVTRKLRIDQKWWSDSLKPFMRIPTARDKEEDDDLARQQQDQPLPKAISEYKNHPLYALRRHLLKFEALYPTEPATLGFIRGEAVYARSCVYTLHSRDIWLKQAKTVKLGETPYKIVKARPKWDRLSNKAITDQLLEIFGPWQVQDYEPPTAENGIVPKNAFGNVDLFKPCMIPKGCVHLKLPGLNKITRRLNIDCAAAIVGFDFHGGWSHPVYDGFIVCEEYEDELISVWELEQDEIERKEQEKLDKRVYGNWRKLIRGLLIKERLKAKYAFGEPSASGSKDKDKKPKGPTFCTKKR